MYTDTKSKKFHIFRWWRSSFMFVPLWPIDWWMWFRSCKYLMFVGRVEGKLDGSVGGWVRHISNKDGWFKGVRKKEEKLTIGKKPPWKRRQPPCWRRESLVTEEKPLQERKRRSPNKRNPSFRERRKFLYLKLCWGSFSLRSLEHCETSSF